MAKKKIEEQGYFYTGKDGKKNQVLSIPEYLSTYNLSPQRKKEILCMFSNVKKGNLQRHLEKEELTKLANSLMKAKSQLPPEARERLQPETANYIEALPHILKNLEKTYTMLYYGPKQYYQRAMEQGNIYQQLSVWQKNVALQEGWTITEMGGEKYVHLDKPTCENMIKRLEIYEQEESITLYAQLVEAQEALQDALKESLPAKAGEAPSPTPFKESNLAAMTTAQPAYGATTAFLCKNGWRADTSARPIYLYEPKGKLRGSRFVYNIWQPWDATEDERILAQKELAWKIVRDFGPNTAWLHMLCLGYLTSPEASHGKNTCVIPKEMVLKCLGLEDRTDLTKEEKFKFALEEIKKLSSLGLQIQQLKITGYSKTKKGKEAVAFDYVEDAIPHPFWNIQILRFGQGMFVFEEGTAKKSWDNWQLIVEPGLWKKFFLREGLWQFGYLAKEMVESIDRRNSIAQALAVYLTWQSRFNIGEPLAVKNQAILEFSGADINPTAKSNRYDLVQTVENAIEEQKKWGWRVNYTKWQPETLRPDIPKQKRPRNYWPKWLQCQTIFHGPAEFVQANKQARKGTSNPTALQAIPEKTLGKASPVSGSKKNWVGSDLKELRKKLGWSQARMAIYIEVDRSYISRLEKGTRPVNPSIENKLNELEKEVTKR